MLSLYFISFSFCFNNTHLPAHWTVPDLTDTLSFPFPIQRTHSTAINEPNWIVTFKLDDFYTNRPKKKKNQMTTKKSPQQEFPKTGINSSSITAYSSDQLKSK